MAGGCAMASEKGEGSPTKNSSDLGVGDGCRCWTSVFSSKLTMQMETIDRMNDRNSAKRFFINSSSNIFIFLSSELLQVLFSVVKHLGGTEKMN